MGSTIERRRVLTTMAPILPRSKLTRSYRPTLNRLDGSPPRVAGLIAEFLLDPDQLVVLGQTIRPRDRARLDLSAVGRNREIGDRRILRLAGPVRHHGGVARPMRHIDGGERLGERANLVDLDEDRIGDAFLDPPLKNFDIGNEDVVADYLAARPKFLGQQLPARPVTLGHTVLDREDGIGVGELDEVRNLFLD